jgi:hypothetical protein
MDNLGKIAGFNILFIICYDILLRVTTNHGNAILISIFIVLGQVLYNLMSAIIYYRSNQKQKANSYLLTTFLVLIIGFGVCVAHFNS